MLLCCLKCRKNTERKNQNHTMYDSKKSKFIKQLEASGLLSNSAIKIPLKKFSLLGPPLF